jgi:hypothetical protein
MGHTRHHAILITTFDKDAAIAAHQRAVDLCQDLVSEIRESAVNGYYSFAIFPDGSSESWPDSDKGDEQRAALKAWLESQRYEDHGSRYDWVEVQYGDDGGETCIIEDSDAWRRQGEPIIVDAVSYLPAAKE